MHCEIYLPDHKKELRTLMREEVERSPRLQELDLNQLTEFVNVLFGREQMA